MTRIDLIIHDAHHLCRRFRMDGKRAMSRGFSGGKHVLKFANRSNLLLYIFKARSKMTGIVNRFYSGTPLIRSPMGQTNLAVLQSNQVKRSRR